MIAVFFDGHCRLCRRTARTLGALDWLGRLQLIDFREERLRRQFAPDIPYEDLDRVTHMLFPNGQMMQGFSAFRRLCWHLPPLWIVAPLLYIPGVKMIGNRIYEKIAKHRKRCAHVSC